MNPEAEALLEEILKIDPESLTEDQKAFLRARRYYLKSSQVEEYKSVLNLEVEKDEENYEDLLNRAKELGYAGKRIKRAELEAFIESKSE